MCVLKTLFPAADDLGIYRIRLEIIYQGLNILGELIKQRIYSNYRQKERRKTGHNALEFHYYHEKHVKRLT